MWSGHVVHGDGISRETASQGAGIYTYIYMYIYEQIRNHDINNAWALGCTESPATQLFVQQTG